MPITQIPFQDPVAPPEKPQPEQLGLYDTNEWETAERDAELHVPHLLIQLQDDLARSRRREAVWISIIVHLVVFMVLWNFNLIESRFWHRAVVVPLDTSKDNSMKILTLPPDAQKLARKPNTNVLSDKDRIAMSRHPQPENHRIVMPPPGAPGMRGPRSAQPTPASPPAMAQNQPNSEPPQQSPPSPRPQFQTDQNQTAQLQTPPRPNPANVFNKYAAGMSAGSAIQQATEAAAARRGAGGGGGQEGDFGLDTGSHGPKGSLEIVSDTLDVDFSSYLARIKIEIERHWYDILPDSVRPPLYKKGKLMIQFTIEANGALAISDMKLLFPSGDVALDRAAWGGITGSNPFPPLPTEFIQKGGKELTLRGAFFYNPDEKDLQ